MRALPFAAAALLLTACPTLTSPPIDPLTTFQVTVTGVYLAGTTTPIDVTSNCVARYGGAAKVPPAVKGTAACRYAIPRGEIEFGFSAIALDTRGQPITDFNGPLSFRVIPGDVSGPYALRWATMANGAITAKVRSIHQYSRARVWVEDAPPKVSYDGGEVLDRGGLPVEPDHRTYATGASPEVFFDDPTLQSLQVPDGFDNRSSPLVGEYVSVGKNPSSGEDLLQSCAADPRRDGKRVAMVVTGTDPSGFFVSDLTACRLQEWTKDSTGAVQVRTPEPPEPCLLAHTAPDGGLEPVALPDGGTTELTVANGSPGVCDVSTKACRSTAECPAYLPGHFGQMFIYNYSYPEGLYQGDLVYTLSGAVQEFTSTTQMTFPAWTIAESVHTLPQEQWNKWLQYVQPRELGMRICGGDNTASPPYLTDQLCGHNKRNLKMESLESALVKVRNVRFPNKFVNCDANSDGSVPFFCEQKDQAGNWAWGTCSFDAPEPETDRVERQCNQDCVISTGPYDGTVCAEESTFIGFGQFPVEMNPPGPAALGFDESLPMRIVKTPVTGATEARLGGYVAGQQLNVVCNVPVRFVVGTGTETVDVSAPLLAARQNTMPSLTGTQTTVSVKAEGTAGTCWSAVNPKMRMNLVAKDALPDLKPDCSPDDADADRAAQCQALRAATFDVVGHMRQVQPARPRWVISPRDPDDVCCHPGPGLGCPRPIQPCP